MNFYCFNLLSFFICCLSLCSFLRRAAFLKLNSLLLCKIFFLLKLSALFSKDFFLSFPCLCNLGLFLKPFLLTFHILEPLLILLILLPLKIFSLHLFLPDLYSSLLCIKFSFCLCFELCLFFFFYLVVSLCFFPPCSILSCLLLGHHLLFLNSFVTDELLLILLTSCGFSSLLLVLGFLCLLNCMLTLKLSLSFGFTFPLLLFFKLVLFANFLLATLVLHHSFNFLLLALLHFLKLGLLFINH